MSQKNTQVGEKKNSLKLSVGRLYIALSTFKHLRVSKEMTLARKSRITLREAFRKEINYYEPIIRIANLFFQPKEEMYNKQVSSIDRTKNSPLRLRTKNERFTNRDFYEVVNEIYNRFHMLVLEDIQLKQTERKICLSGYINSSKRTTSIAIYTYHKFKDIYIIIDYMMRGKWHYHIETILVR